MIHEATLAPGPPPVVPKADAPIEITSVAEFDELARTGKPLEHCVFQSVDLTGRTKELMSKSLKGAIFLGGVMAPEALAHAQATGALIFPTIGDLPYNPYRHACYTVEELYDGFVPGVPGTYRKSLDARIYDYYDKVGRDRPKSFRQALAMRLHDHSITDALDEVIEGRKIVAFMGGHKLSRASSEYRDVARIARALYRKGFTVATGGGPGAMEAAHLGAWIARWRDGALDEALAILAEAPVFEPVESWLTAAFEVRKRFPPPESEEERSRSLGIPTWFYGHEPPNAFAMQIAKYFAKYFANSVREEGLLAIARNGVIFARGSAGTIQEIFQDAAQNHYGTFDGPSPMVFLGEMYWTAEKPVFPLLAQLAAGEKYSRWLKIADDPEKIVGFIEEYEKAVRPVAQVLT